MQRYKIAYLFQNYALVENETVDQNLMIALYFQKGEDKKGKIRKALKLVGLEGITVVFVTRDMELMQLADKIIEV